MAQKLGRYRESASQTAGPYVHIGCTPSATGIVGVYASDLGASMLNPDTEGERIGITGQIVDGAGDVLGDAMIEIWQPDAQGLYASVNETRGDADANFTGWGRCAVDMETGFYRFDTIKPGRAPYGDGRLMAPHVTLWVVARGINIGLHTRMYFSDEEAANAEDPVLMGIGQPNRAATLIGQRDKDGTDYRFDIRLQGDNETVFFDI